MPLVQIYIQTIKLDFPNVAQCDYQTCYVKNRTVNYLECMTGVKGKWHQFQAVYIVRLSSGRKCIEMVKRIEYARLLVETARVV